MVKKPQAEPGVGAAALCGGWQGTQEGWPGHPPLQQDLPELHLPPGTRQSPSQEPPSQPESRSGWDSLPPSTSSPRASWRLPPHRHLLRREIPLRFPLRSSLPSPAARWDRRGQRHPPDFGGELHAGFDDQGPVGVHGHAGLPLHDESAAGEKHKNQSQTPGPAQRARCPPLHPLPVPRDCPQLLPSPRHLFIRFLNSSTIRSSSMGRCWTIGSPL